ncbi:site-specific recombinase XerD [Roseinatronobacter thiooxidans]|uniref:Site-specific recombinase XerD n=2 Tax=Roseinatronobacter thiooxidans TaxID=121821 RepID=A0A2W7Q5F7_9RHOB|nr:site-specific integrase [Roseinatronobacter thiooxidans]PZX39397.1 site-specific recombinase XerD [Roseinatronobacter thiooxidans]
MAIRQRGRGWQVDVTVGGIRAPRVTRVSKRAALQTEELFRDALKRGCNPESLRTKPSESRRNTSKILTLEELLNVTRQMRWRDTKGEATALMNARAWCDAFGPDYLVADLTPQAVAYICDDWSDMGAAAGTVNRKVSSLSVMLRVAEQRGIIPSRFALPHRREYEGRLRYFSDQEVESLIEFVADYPEIQDLMVAAVETGMRLGELQRMIVRDIDFERRMILLGETKGDRRRSVPMTRRVEGVLKRKIVGLKDHENVFASYLNSRNLSRVMRRWKEHRGLHPTDQACFHTFRHTTCSRLVQRGVPLAKVMAFMGHRVIETTMRYAHLAPNCLDEARDALE